MSKHHRWLLTEIERWTADNLISAEQAARLRARYAIAADGPPWGLLVFASAGALVIGLGVILLIGYNWDEIPKFGKLALVFAAVIGVHAAGLIYHRKDGWQRRLGEALSLLGTMFFGAGIWLVAQIYHIDEHYPTGFLVWALGALALAWVFESIPHALLATLLLGVWGGAEVFHFRNPNPWALALVIAGLVPLAWRRRSALLLAFVLAAVEMLLLANVAHHGGGSHVITSALALGGLLIAAARLTATGNPEFSNGARVMAGFGFAGFLVCAYLLGFHDAAGELLDWTRHGGTRTDVATLHCWVAFTLACGAWSLVGWRAITGVLRPAVEEWLVPIALIYAYGLAALGFGNSDYRWFIAASFNLVLLGIAVMWMWRGCNESRLRPTVMGSLIFAAVVLARYFDLFQSLAARGFAFIVLGGIFMAEAMYYRRNRRTEPRATGGAS